MKVGRLSANGSLVVEEVDPPRAGPGELVVELAACGVCGTDLEKVRGNYRTAGKLGHEPVGTIVEVGRGAESYLIGDRVFVHHHVPCGTCDVCRRGDLTFCPTYSQTNIDPGGFAERFRVPRENVDRGAVHRLDPAISWETGSLLEPAGCAVTALRRVGLRPGDTVAVIGLGPVGLLYAGLAHALGASWVLGVEVSAFRRLAAERLGVDRTIDARDGEAVERAVAEGTRGVGVDLAVVATGAPAALPLALRLPRRGGTLNLFGLPESGSRLEADLQELYLRGLKVIPSYATTERDVEDVHRLLLGGRLSFAGLVSHRVPLDRLPEAFALAGRPNEAVKVVATGPSFAG